VAALVFVGIGWSAHALFGNVLADPVAAAHPIPVFADEAVEAHRSTVEAGATLGGQPPEQASLLARVASQAAGGALPIPEFPKELRALASRIVPWDVGSAVQVVYATSNFDRVTLFAAEDSSFSVSRPESVRFGELSVVYWQQGHHVYALCSQLPAAKLMAYAEAVQASWF
jgi:anti-sigma factor RsiW